MSPLPPDYVSPHLLNIPVPDVPPSTPPRSSRMMQMTTENTAERYSTAHGIIIVSMLSVKLIKFTITTVYYSNGYSLVFYLSNQEV